MVGHQVAIAGAGIAGLTAALSLARIGCAVTVVERRTGFSEPGAGIQLSPNASRILIDLGLEAPLRRVASEPPGVVIRDSSTGQAIGHVALGRFAAERYGAPYLVVQRADLHTLLLDAVRSQGIALLLGRRAVSVESDAPATSLVFEGSDGERRSIGADLVVGADGVWSSLREAFGGARARHAGFRAWRSTVPRERAGAIAAEDATGLWLGRRAHVVHYPIGRGTLVNVVAVLRSPSAVEGWSEVGHPETIRGLFAGQAGPLRDLIGAGEEWRVWSLYDLPATGAGRNRLALIGDAAHPVLPFLAQGGAMAIEDAAVLAAAVQSCGADLTAATRRYARERLARIRRVQAAARRNGRVYHLAGPAAWARNLLMARLGPEGMTTRYDWLYGWTADRALGPA